MTDTDTVDLSVLKSLGGDNLDIPFWEGTARGEFLLHRCNVCGRHYWPASRCIEHGDTDMQWVPGSGRGTIHTYTIVYHAYTPRMATRVPYPVAVVQLEEGPFFHTNIVDCPVEAVKVDLAVTVRFEPDETSGLTLPVFVPAR